MTNQYGKSLTNINTMLTMLTLGGDFIVMILSASFLARVLFGYSNIYAFVKYGTLVIFAFSLLGHVFISSKNILIIDHRQNILTTIIRLLVYPVGVWTIQETLKQK